MTNQTQIQQTIQALEQQRSTLDGIVVDTAVAALNHQLSHLHQAKIPVTALQGERKQVTVMFADISGFTAMSEKLDPEEVRNLINSCFEGLGQVIDRYGGHIDKFIGDEVMALFGAPVAHENDPERALRAALDMMQALTEFNRKHADLIPKPLALHFGINSGLVIAGGIGTRQRQDYSVMGDTVNLAARLEDLSETGEILVGEATYRLTAPLFEFEALPPVSLKGKAQPVQVYRLLKARAVSGGQIRGIEGLYSPLVGRVEEFARLREAAAHFQSGQGCVVSIVGDAGLGKSRLIQELFETQQSSNNSHWADGRALSHADSASYLVARDILRTLLGISLETPPLQAASVLQTKLEQLLPAQSTELYPYLARMLDLPLADAAQQRLRYLEGEVLQQRILQAVQTFILAHTQQIPLILVWEDLHWADPSSLELLQSLLPLTGQHPMLLLLVYRRPIKDSKIWAFHDMVQQTPGINRLLIEPPPLTAAESQTLLNNLLGPGALPANIMALIVRKAEGNPFYLEEVIRSLINRGVLVRAANNQGWQSTPELDDIELPDTLQGIIMARVDQLEPESKRLLQIASVMGRNFSVNILEQVINRLQSR